MTGVARDGGSERPGTGGPLPGDVPPRPFRYARQIFLAICGLVLAAVVVAAQDVMLPFMLAVLVGYVLFPAVRAVERKWVPRWLAILLVYAVAIGSAVAFASAVVPRLFDETKKLSNELPRLTQRIRDDWLPALDARLQRWTRVDDKPQGAKPAYVAPADSASPSASASAAPSSPAATAVPIPTVPLPPPITIHPGKDGSYEIHVSERLQFSKQEDGSFVVGPPAEEPRGFSSERAFRDAFDRAVSYAQKNSLELLDLGRRIVGGVSRGIFYFFLTLMLAGYMMYTYERIHAFVREMWPPHRRAAFDRFLQRVDRGLAGVVRGQLLICVVNGVLSAIGFWIFDLKYWPILAVIAAAMSIIPIFGSILSSVPVVAIGLTQSFGTALGVLIWIVGIHQLEANFLNPKIIGDQAKIHPVLVVFALLLGEHYYQITGALLAVPCLALAQALFLHFRESILGIPARISLSPDPVAATAGGAPSADDRPTLVEELVEQPAEDTAPEPMLESVEVELPSEPPTEAATTEAVTTEPATGDAPAADPRGRRKSSKLRSTLKSRSE